MGRLHPNFSTGSTMRKIIVGGIAAVTFAAVAGAVFAQAMFDPARVRQAYQAADEGMRLTQSMHRDYTHNFGGHMERAYERFRQAHDELVEAEQFARQRGERPGPGA